MGNDARTRRARHEQQFLLGKWLAARLGRLTTLHRDERGTISIVTVFSVMLLAMLLGMVMNSGRQVDGKVKMQNAADAATWSGGIVLARSMNTLAFTNHLLCDIFSVTAILREASQHNAEHMVPEILAAWTKIGPILGRSQFARFGALGPAITQKVPLEQQMVTAYGNWTAATANLVLPLWEQILSQELIPQFQRALVNATPRLAQTAAAEIARRHGLGSRERGPMAAVLWRTMGMPVQSEAEMLRRTLPVVDPEMDSGPNQSQYRQTAVQQRNNLAQTYLTQWNNATLSGFDQLGKMSQFGALWRGFTCGQLNKLLNQDYPNSNLPFVIRTPDMQSSGTNGYLDQDFKFVGVAYWPQIRETLPGLFKNANRGDAMAFSEIMLFIPSPRLVRMWSGGGGAPPPPGGLNIGGVPGDSVTLPAPPGAAPVAPPGPVGPAAPPVWTVGRESKPTDWDLLNQSWTIKVVPAVSASIPTILGTTPPSITVVDNGQQRSVRVPQLGNFSEQQLGVITTH
jgi:hypothetical protein